MKKEPFVTKEQIEEIVKTYPTPFHLYDEKGIRENAKAVKEAVSYTHLRSTWRKSQALQLTILNCSRVSMYQERMP